MDNQFPDMDGSFVHKWRSNISFTLYYIVGKHYSEAAQKALQCKHLEKFAAHNIAT